HDGLPCPQTIEGMKATALANVRVTTSKGQGHIDTIPLSLIQDGLESPVIDPQLPTPRGTPHPEGPMHIPIISDTLFDHPETFLDSEDNSPNQKYTAPSGNMMLTIVDQNGVFEHEVVFCVCSKDDIKDKLLLHCGLFPATFKSIKTVFTFSVLDDFLRDNLECKTTAQHYYSKLQRLPGSEETSRIEWSGALDIKKGTIFERVQWVYFVQHAHSLESIFQMIGVSDMSRM
ncbi:hypothetical protein EI94DRAFT_1708366, partial [Lactarius quietus]